MMLNKKFKIFAEILLFIFFALTVLCLFCACINFNQVDNLSDKLEFYKNSPADRIIALSPSDCEVLYEIGAGDKIIGRSSNCDYPEIVKEIKDYGYGQILNLEEMISAKPDVIIADKGTLNPNQVLRLNEKDIFVYETNNNSFEDIYKYINSIGIIAGYSQNADNLICKIKDCYSHVYNLSHEKKLKDKTVYIEISPLNLGLWTSGKNTFINQTLECLNLINIFEDIDGWSEVAQEQVISRNPSYIFSVHTLGNPQANIDEISNRAGWSNISAVQNSMIFCFDDNTLSRPGPRLIDSIYKMYNIVYG